MTLFDAILDRDKDLLFKLIFADVDVNSPNDIGNRPMHAAAFVGDCEVMAILLRAGAKPHVQGGKGRTPLHVAAAQGNVNAVEFLLNLAPHTVDPLSKDNNGKSARDLVLENSHVAKILDEWVMRQWLSYWKESGSGDAASTPSRTKTLLRSPSSSSYPGSTTTTTSQVDDVGVVRLLEALETRRAHSSPPAISTTNSPPTFTDRTVKSTPISPRSFIKSDTPPSPHPVQEETSDHAADEAAGANNKDEDGFWMTMDGVDVFIPRSVIDRPPQQGVTDDHVKPDNDDGDDDDVITAAVMEAKKRNLILEEVLVFVIVIPTPSTSLGLLLQEDAGVDGIQVSQVVSGSPAHVAGIRRGDVVMTIGTVPVLADDSVETVVELLHKTKQACGEATPLRLTMRRLSLLIVKKALLAVERNEVFDWEQNVSDYDEFKVLVAFLREPPPSATQDEMLAGLRAFQSAVAVLRLHCGDSDLIDEWILHLRDCACSILSWKNFSRDELEERAKDVITLALGHVARLDNVTVEEDEADLSLKSKFKSMLLGGGG